VTRQLTSSEIEQAFIAACRLEVRALKPGNVHIYADGHGMRVADFEKSAEAAAPHIANPNLRVGQRIRRAVDATFEAVQCNTNLGIILLCAPLALAAGTPLAVAAGAPSGNTLEQRLKTVLANLNDDDTRDVFATIARATPGGLGEASDGDVRAAPPPGMTLMKAMDLAESRDLIAREYISGFKHIFALEQDRYAARLANGWSAEDALARIFISELARVADTHIARKFGAARAEDVRASAAQFKADGLNPGSLADLMAATAFTHNLKAASSNPATAL
jgi:triphosphoribosyl-dephospho-CoA synthase